MIRYFMTIPEAVSLILQAGAMAEGYGTLNVARAAGAYGTGKFINVSTDKAVNPVNVMGATKRLAEMIVRGLAGEYPETVYASVPWSSIIGTCL
jgi:FlaA1/EpsC-like NDP-sugar epimerase